MTFLSTIIPIHLSLRSMFKSCSEKGLSEDEKKWLLFWVVYALSSLVETNLAWILGFVPNYKIHKIVWLCLLMTKPGQSVLYAFIPKIDLIEEQTQLE